MTNFERLLRGATVEQAAEAMHEVYPGQCDSCPAYKLCKQFADDDEISCTDVLTLWLNMEEDKDDE